MNIDLSKFTKAELVNELKKRGDNFHLFSSEPNENSTSNFLQINFDEVYDSTHEFSDVSSEFHYENFQKVYNSLNWKILNYQIMESVVDSICSKLESLDHVDKLLKGVLKK